MTLTRQQELEAARNLEPDCDYGAVGAGKYTREMSERLRGRRARQEVENAMTKDQLDVGLLPLDRIATLERVLDPTNEGQWGHMDLESSTTVRALLAERERMLPIYQEHLEREQRRAETYELECRRIASLTEHEQHRELRHPDYEYVSMENAWKSGEAPMPHGEGWEENDIVSWYADGAVVEKRWRNWMRDDYTETYYWRRRKPAKEQP